jgi:hypothetical protein
MWRHFLQGLSILLKITESDRREKLYDSRFEARVGYMEKGMRTGMERCTPKWSTRVLQMRYLKYETACRHSGAFCLGWKSVCSFTAGKFDANLRLLSGFLARNFIFGLIMQYSSLSIIGKIIPKPKNTCLYSIMHSNQFQRYSSVFYSFLMYGYK